MSGRNVVDSSAWIECLANTKQSAHFAAPGHLRARTNPLCLSSFGHWTTISANSRMSAISSNHEHDVWDRTAVFLQERGDEFRLLL